MIQNCDRRSEVDGPAGAPLRDFFILSNMRAA